MSSITSVRPRVSSKHLDICIGGIGNQTEPHTLLTYFEQFGAIHHYSFSSPNGGGFLFLTYEDTKGVERCIAHRPHRIDGRHLYVKRALPFDADYPREHLDSARDLMVLTNSLHTDERFLFALREYFSSYGTLYACKYCHESNFDYVLIEFADVDQVDRIILAKPHRLNDEELQVIKCTPSNKNLLNLKYSSKSNSIRSGKDTTDIDDDDDDQKFVKYELNYRKEHFETHTDIDLENEVDRLHTQLKQVTEDFSKKCKQLEENYCEQLRKLNEDSEQTYRLQQDLEQEYTKLLNEHELLKQENARLSEEYLMAELENFEITSYYEQILAEEKSRSLEYENEISSKPVNDPSPMPPAIPDDDD